MGNKKYRLIFAIACLLFQQALVAQSLLPVGQIFSFEDTQHNILNVDEAFRVSVNRRDATSVVVRWEITPGYYLYRDKLTLSTASDAIRIGPYLHPPGIIKEDIAFGKIEVYYGVVEITAPLIGPPLTIFPLEIRYQGCKENSVCYPPVIKTLTVGLDGISDTPTLYDQQVKDRQENNAADSDTSPLYSQQIKEQGIIKALQQKNIFVSMIIFFGFGLLLSLTPCIFPMIPILSGLIVGQRHIKGSFKAFQLSMVYVLAMAFIYALLGILAGLFGFNVQAYAQNVWVISLFSLVFVGLACSMFGFYDLQLPSGWQTKISSMNTNRSGTFFGAAVMGILSAIIVGPCVAPPLAAVLLYISQTNDAILGGLVLFSMGLGFGVPLLLIGTSCGGLMPKVGIWMQGIKNIFGVLMLAVAIWFLERVLPAQITLLLWSGLCIITAVYMGALDRLEVGVVWRRFWKGLGLVLFLYGIILLLGSVSGGRDLVQPLPKFSQINVANDGLVFQDINSIEGLQVALEQADRTARPVMFEFYADWCVVCHEIERHTFTDETVQKTLGHFLLLKADVTRYTPQDRALLGKFGLFGPPALLFFNYKGEELTNHRVIGFIGATDLNQLLTTISTSNKTLTL